MMNPMGMMGGMGMPGSGSQSGNPNGSNDGSKTIRRLGNGRR